MVWIKKEDKFFLVRQIIYDHYFWKNRESTNDSSIKVFVVPERPKKPTVLLVRSLVPMERLQEAEDLSKLWHSPPSGLWRTFSFRSSVDSKTAPSCKKKKKLQQQSRLDLSLCVRADEDRMHSMGPSGKKEEKRLRSEAGEVKCPLSNQLDRDSQKSLYVWIVFGEDRDYDLVKYPSKDVLSWPVAYH